jgi:hypothetical protein
MHDHFISEVIFVQHSAVTIIRRCGIPYHDPRVLRSHILQLKLTNREIVVLSDRDLLSHQFT